jgi:hypothetical protein
MNTKMKLWTRADPACGTMDNYAGEDMRNYYVFPLSRTRDSGLLTNHNFNYCWDKISHKARAGTGVYLFNHWACGWYEIILINKNNSMAILLAEDLISEYENYPIFNEDEYNDKEYQYVIDQWENATLSNRLDMLKSAHPHDSNINIFGIRHADYFREDDYLFDYLRPED